MAQIEITIAADGQVTSKVNGGCGPSCRDATKPIRDALGKTTDDKALPEIHRVQVGAGAGVAKLGRGEP